MTWSGTSNPDQTLTYNAIDLELVDNGVLLLSMAGNLTGDKLFVSKDNAANWGEVTRPVGLNVINYDVDLLQLENREFVWSESQW